MSNCPDFIQVRAGLKAWIGQLLSGNSGDFNGTHVTSRLDTAKIIPLPQNDRSRSIQVVKTLKKSVDIKLAYLFEGLCMNAADALFEEQYGAADEEALTRQFNITRALRVQAEPHLQAYKTLMGQSWVNLLNRKDEPALMPPAEAITLLEGYAQRNRNHYKILLEELRQRFSALAGIELQHHPLLPLNFLVCFWHSMDCLELDANERKLLLVLFNRFVMDRFGQILALANQSLAERGLNPVSAG
ncbi:MAG: DUF1631 family protein [Pseudomonadales bacterium]